MSKAKLSQIKSTWVEESDVKKLGKVITIESNMITEEQQARKQQTFTLKTEAIKRLWMHRAITGKTISETLDELVLKHIPKHS